MMIRYDTSTQRRVRKYAQPQKRLAELGTLGRAMGAAAVAGVGGRQRARLPASPCQMAPQKAGLRADYARTGRRRHPSRPCATRPPRDACLALNHHCSPRRTSSIYASPCLASNSPSSIFTSPDNVWVAATTVPQDAVMQVRLSLDSLDAHTLFDLTLTFRLSGFRR